MCHLCWSIDHTVLSVCHHFFCKVIIAPTGPSPETNIDLRALAICHVSLCVCVREMEDWLATLIISVPCVLIDKLLKGQMLFWPVDQGEGEQRIVCSSQHGCSTPHTGFSLFLALCVSRRTHTLTNPISISFLVSQTLSGSYQTLIERWIDSGGVAYRQVYVNLVLGSSRSCEWN